MKDQIVARIAERAAGDIARTLGVASGKLEATDMRKLPSFTRH